MDDGDECVVGRYVRLRSGGPTMYVEMAEVGGRALCSWIGPERLEQRSFMPATLEFADEDAALFKASALRRAVDSIEDLESGSRRHRALGRYLRTKLQDGRILRPRFWAQVALALSGETAPGLEPLDLDAYFS